MTPQVAVFTDTNLGTHIAVQVSQDIRAADFKRELKKAHYSCFPKLGIINILALMVKQNSVFYHLPDSLLLRDVFRDIKGSWSISVNARSCSSNHQNRLSRVIRWIRGFPFRNIIKIKKKKTKKKKKNGIRNEDQREIDVIVSETIPETEETSVSVSSIINKYFSDYNDMESESQKSQNWVFKTPPSRKVISKGRRSRAVVASREEEDAVFSGKGIGRRILSASSNLRTQQKSGISRLGDRKSKDPSIRTLVFEISDNDNDNDDN